MGLSLSKVAPGRQRYYLEVVASGAEDRGAPGLEPEGSWMGAGSQSLGLVGEAPSDQVDTVLSGADPVTGERLRSPRHPVRVAGFDLCFSAPKSASILFALADARVSSEVQRGHERAVGSALGYLEREAFASRRGSGAWRVEVPVRGAVAAGFLHRTSRAADPHLHSHVLVANLVEDLEGRWSALDARGVFSMARTAGFLYEAHLRYELASRLGVRWNAVRNGRADIDLFTPRLLREFSRRGLEVQAVLDKWGVDSLKAGNLAALTTRRSKDLSVGFDALRREWLDRARRLGMGRDELGAALQRERLEGREGPRRTGSREGGGSGHGGSGGCGGGGGFDLAALPEPDLARRALGEAGLTRSRSTFSRAELIRQCCEALPGGAPVAEIERLSDRVLGSSLVCDPVRLAPGAGPAGSVVRAIGTWSPFPSWGRDERRWSTREAVATELSVVESWRRRAREGLSIQDGHTEGALLRRPDLRFSQRQAVARVLGSGSGVEVAWGSPRWGALDGIDALREAWQSAGLRVIGTAPGRREVAELDAIAGIESVPLGELAAGLDRPGGGLPVGCVLVVGAAADAPFRELARVVEAAAVSRAKVLLVTGTSSGRAVGGDRLGVLEALASASESPDLGSDFRAWSEARADRRFPEVRADRRLVELAGTFGSARTGAGLGATHVLSGPEWSGSAGDEVVVVKAAPDVAIGTRLNAVRDRMLVEWWSARGRGEAVEMVATRGREVDVLNARARKMLDAAGQLGPIVRQGTLPEPGVSEPRVSEPGVSELRLGDEVIVSKHKHRSLPPPGTRAVVVGVGERPDELRLRTRGAGEWRVSEREALACGLTHSYAVGPWSREGSRGTRELVLGDDRLLAACGRRPAGRERVQFVVRESAERENVLGHAAVLSAPGYLVDELGPPPENLWERGRWRRAAGRVQAYRERWGVTEPQRSLGGPLRGASVLQSVERAEAGRALAAAARELRQEPVRARRLERAKSIERTVERCMELDAV